ERADGPFDLDLIRDDVEVRFPRIESRDRHDAGFQRIRITADDRLQTLEQSCRNSQRVFIVLWHAGMAAFTLHRNFKSVAARHERTRQGTDLAERHRRNDMCTEDAVDTVERAVLDHEFRTARNDFLCELVQEHYFTRNLLLIGK